MRSTDIRIGSENKKAVLDIIASGRIPHTVIIEGDSKEERGSAALLLAAGAVCSSGEKPCLECLPCRKILEGTHPDLTVPQPSKKLKSGIISLEDLRLCLQDASIKPNEADLRIYIFYDADKLLREDSQNTLLKIIEEPPQNILFIFTVEKAKTLLGTVRSRARIITLKSAFEQDEEITQAARGLVDGIVSLYEYDLLLALSSLGDKTRASQALTALGEELRTALLYQSGIGTDDESARKLAKKLDRRRLIELTEATFDAAGRLKTNVNQQLIMTWLCSRYRRITWQK